MNLAKLNHVLIPSTKAGRDRLRKSIFGRGFDALSRLYYSFSRSGRVVVALWMFSGLLGIEVRSRQAYLLWCALTGLLIASIAIRRFFALDGVHIDVSSPRLISVGEEATFTITLENRGEREHQVIRVDGPLLPWDGQFVTMRALVPRLERDATEEAIISARFSARGEHHLDPFTVSSLVPFGLASGPLLGSRGVRFLVVPKIAPVTTLRTPRIQRYQPGGVALASQIGESMELIGLRPYRPGDPVRDLHPKRWARLGTPVVREYQQEYFTRIGVVVDTDIRHSDEARLEAGLSLAAGVVAHLSRGEALIDLLVVGGELHQLTLGRSLGFVDQALELLACVEPGPEFSPDTLNFHLAPHLARLSSIVFISLTWDTRRQEFVDRIRRGGVGCRALSVTKEHDADHGLANGADLTELSTGSIRSGKAISL